MTMTVFGYLMLISIDFYDLFLHFLLNFSFDWEDISNTQYNVWTLSNVWTPRSSSKILRCVSYFPTGVWKYGQTRSFVFDRVNPIPQTTQSRCLPWYFKLFGCIDDSFYFICRETGANLRRRAKTRLLSQKPKPPLQYRLRLLPLSTSSC